jgi:hypothetical protein
MMMKKQYTIPTAQVIRLEHNPLLLDYSVNPPGDGGNEQDGGDIPKH